ncbi:uncharacterized protein C8Q71DRAFT_843952 [Rhodofomes roseus]|uniref:Uncharacterized protein n=1 Tax=Rhodofomes roseus TaxID=34475 RepID=A0ABQ8JZI7_9APHY|nr:uncharacterized protein C8Q71DRAFT_843952 [Rhodofomes roseus]KAH9829237.1 hypothetical protein C8Q71DRAFT_843952 [Rhodofomes roseus]
MSDFSSMSPSTGPPRSPLFGTATFSTLSPTQTPMSPSRFSSSFRSATPVASSYDSDDASSGRQMRRIVVSPSPTSRGSEAYTYDEEDSINDAAEVEAELAQINDDIDDFLSEVSRNSSREASTYTSYTGPSTYTSYTGPSTYTTRTDSVSNAGSGTSGNHRSAAGTMSMAERGPRVLSTISEHTENTPSRPSSYPSAGDGNRLSAHIEGVVSHVRSATEPSQATQPPRPLPSTPGPKVGERIAFFEDRTAASSGSPAPLFGHTRMASAPSAIRSPSPFTTTQSRSMPTLSSTGYGYGTTTGYGSTTYGSRPSSRTGSAASYSGLNTTMSSMLSPPPHSALSWDSRDPTSTAETTLTTRTPVSGSTYTASGTETGTYTNPSSNTFSNTLTSFVDTTTTPTAPSLTPRQMSPNDRTALSQVRNVINRWKERTPSMAKSERSTTSPSPTQSDGLFSIRRRASRGSARLRDRALQAGNRNGGRRASDPVSTTGLDESGSGSLSTSGLLPPPFDINEMGQYVGAPEAQEVSIHD